MKIEASPSEQGWVLNLWCKDTRRAQEIARDCGCSVYYFDNGLVAYGDGQHIRALRSKLRATIKD